MTLCIAAASRTEDNGLPVIVMAADFKVETEFAGAEVGFKLSWLAKDWPAMFAGDVARARELMQTYMTRLEDVELNDDNLYAMLRQPAQMQKLAFCEHHVRMKYGMSYDDFLAKGRGCLSDAAFQETEYEIARLDLGCELITCGFPPSKYPMLDRLPHIFTIDASGHVCRHDNFATIGTGSIIAQSVLYQRRLTYAAPLARTLYVVYEAMRLAHIAPGVGRKITMIVIAPIPGGRLVAAQMVSPKAAVVFRKQFDQYGPKELDVLPKLDPDCFDELREAPATDTQDT